MTHRFLATLAALAALAPALASAQPTPPPPPEPTLEFVFEEVIGLGAAISPGKTAIGDRNIVPITGGTFEGPGLKGTIMPGAWDWQLRRPDGCTELKADYFLKTDDGVVINVVNKGALCPAATGQPANRSTQPVLEAPIGKYDWLSKSTLISTIALAKAPDGGVAVRIRFYRVR